MEELLTDSKVKMQKTIESFQNNLSKIRQVEQISAYLIIFLLIIMEH
jgi:ribosome recycling factor